MSYIVRIGSYDILCDTAADVHALIAFKPGVPNRRVIVSGQTSDRKMTTSRTFLQAVLSDQRGITSAALVAALGFKGPKGLGGAMGFVHEFLDEIGLSPGDVYHTEKRSDAKYWIPGPKAQDALAALESK